MTSQSNDDPMGPVVVRVLTGPTTPEDEAALRAWLVGDPPHERELNELRTVWNESGKLQDDWDTTELRQRILAAVEAKVVPIQSDRRRPHYGLPAGLLSAGQRSWLPIALAASLLLAVGTLLWRLAVPPATPVAVQPPALTEITTKRGQRAELYLTDGTRITLGVDSWLRYPEQFATSASRDVYLQGEAYFEVARDTLRPFQVHSGTVVTRVLGTRFGVRAYAEDRTLQVVVAEGKVSLEPGGGGDVVLGGGDLARMETGRAPVVRHGVDVSSHLAWVDGRLVFVDTPLSEVARRLSRWYDLDIRLGTPSLADDPFTMSLLGSESVEHVLRTIAAAVGARVERRGTAYVIMSREEVR